MIVKTYGLLDGVGKEVVRTFTSNNDESAIRMVEIMLRDPKTDRSQAKDFILLYLYSMDTSDGSIIDINKKEIIALASIMPEKVDVDTSNLEEINKKFDAQDAMIHQLRSAIDNLRQALEALSIPVKALDPALGQVHPYIDRKKGKVLWLPKK